LSAKKAPTSAEALSKGGDLDSRITDSSLSPLDKALALAAIGCYVHPCREQDSSYVKNGVGIPLKAKTGYLTHGHLEASTDPDQIKRWWRRWPNALAGVAAGMSGLVCLDIDMDAEKGIDGWATLTELGLDDLPPTVNYKTRRGGEHWIYKAPKGIPLDGKKDYRGMSGIDRRGGSSYFIWWGATVPTSRKAFK
jgi:putative DNA primase/helicase